jgi:hypothetical protein
MARVTKKLCLTVLLFVFFTFALSDLVISQGQTLNVYITSLALAQHDSAAKKTLRKDLEKKYSEAKKQKKELEKQLKAQFGKDKKMWPLETQQKFKQAEDLERMVTVEFVALENTQKDLDDTVADMKRTILGEGVPKPKKYLNLVGTPEEADLVVEVMSRKREGVPGLVACVDCTYFVYLKVTPAVEIDTTKLGMVVPENFGVRRIHQYRSDEPFWIIEASSLARWGHAANQAAGALNKFVEENIGVFQKSSSAELR